MKYRALLVVVLLAQFCVGRETRVRAGQSIQSAVDQAQLGDRVVVEPGTYHEVGRPCPSAPSVMCAVSITRSGVALEGRPRDGSAVILANAGGQDAGIEVANPKSATTPCFSDPSARIA